MMPSQLGSQPGKRLQQHHCTYASSACASSTGQRRNAVGLGPTVARKMLALAAIPPLQPAI